MNLIICGDTCFNSQHDTDPVQSESILHEILPVLDGADIRIMNLECPIAAENIGAPIRKSGPNLTGRPGNVEFLKAARCDLAILANNHTMDFGEAAFNETERILDASGISHIGAGANINSAYSAYRNSLDGTSVSVIAVCENEFGTAGENTSGTAGFDIDRLADRIREEKSVSDFCIVIFHGGCEHNPFPSPMCRTRYRLLIRLGADAVIGMHTHCPQGFEYFEGKPILYSLGNFLFKHGPNVGEAWFFGCLARLTLKKGGMPVSETIPYRFTRDRSKILPLCGEERTAMLDYIKKISGPIRDSRLLSDYYSGWCMISGIPYIKGLVMKSEYLDLQNQPADIAPLLNLYSCESHNELMLHTLKILFDGTMRDALVRKEKVAGFMRMPVGSDL